MKILFLFYLLLPRLVAGFDYSLTGEAGLVLTDIETGIKDIKTIFRQEDTLVSVKDIKWQANADGDTTGSTTLSWQTRVDGRLIASGQVSLADVGRELPTTIENAGNFTFDQRGRVQVQVLMQVDASNSTGSGEYQAYNKGWSLAPLLVVLVLAMTTRMVELSLFTAVFVGSCMVAGNVIDGFKLMLSNYILKAVVNEDHGYVYLFTLFLSGVVGMMERSGGMFGFTRDISKCAKTARTGQACCFIIGVLIFFDDYANVLLAGETMRPLLDSLYVSREKLAFIVDATAAPVASLSPVSSWVGFEVGLIQAEIDKIIEQEGTDDIGIKTSGFGVFIQSIKYRYYPIFMIVLMVFLIFSKRDYGTMLVAERKTMVYKRTDGGDGKGKASEMDSKPNQPHEDTPLLSWNMFIPVILLIFFIFYLLVKTGEIPGVEQTFMDKIENSNSYAALLWGTMATTVCTVLLYILQIVQDGRVVFPFPSVLKKLFSFRKVKDEDAPSKPRFLMSVYDSVESFLYGMGRIFPALIVLTLAWASSAVMTDVGADRLFSRWIVGGVAPQALPTMSFVIAFFIALATGTSWGTMAILFPLILVPTYNSSGGDATIFYATTAGVLSGSVAGDHVSPISDTTVLSALACDCNLLAHVATQAPYALVIVVVSIVLGTIPIGYDAWPNYVSILLGSFLTIAFVYAMCVPVIARTGRYDVITESRMRCKCGQEEESPLVQLKQDTVRAYNGEQFGENNNLLDGKEDESLDFHEDEEIVEATDKLDLDLSEESPEQEEEEVQKV